MASEELRGANVNVEHEGHPEGQDLDANRSSEQNLKQKQVPHIDNSNEGVKPEAGSSNNFPGKSQLSRINKRLKDNLDLATFLLTTLGVIGGLVGIVFLILQTHSLSTQTELLHKQTELSYQQYDATYRPYISIEDIKTEFENDTNLNILITVKNYGQVPATNVELTTAAMASEVNVEYNPTTGKYTFIYMDNGTENDLKVITTTSNGVSVSSSDTYVIGLTGENFPPDMIFFPGREQVINVTVDKARFQSEVTKSKVTYIGLGYSWGSQQYYYLAAANIDNDKWKLIQSRGN